MALFPSSYDMSSGETGTFTPWDDSYNGSGNPTISGGWPSGDVGGLTDRVIATQNWFATPGIHVGWRDVESLVVFHFPEAYFFESMTISVDDSNGNGGRSTPNQTILEVNGGFSGCSLQDGDSGAPLSFSFPINDTKDTITLTLVDGTGARVFLSEVPFSGVPTPGTAGLLAAAGVAGLRRRR